jgi:hypothetical protein
VIVIDSSSDEEVEFEDEAPAAGDRNHGTAVVAARAAPPLPSSTARAASTVVTPNLLQQAHAWPAPATSSASLSNGVSSWAENGTRNVGAALGVGGAGSAGDQHNAASSSGLLSMQRFGSEGAGGSTGTLPPQVTPHRMVCARLGVVTHGL